MTVSIVLTPAICRSCLGLICPRNSYLFRVASNKDRYVAMNSIKEVNYESRSG
jgi:hypothetical protein